ncbi:MAG TPA: hypothetical protein VL088_05005 [Pedobacter sp.]|nr:hypothetical protein [Pedobacter sp.]
MKKLIFLFAIALLIACAPKEAETVKTQIFLEQKLSEFIAGNPDWTKDEATEKETTEKFKHKLINLSNEADFLKDMPLQLKEIKDTSINEIRTKIATFKAYGDTSRNKTSLLNYVQLQITGIISDAQSNELKVAKKYTISGSLHKQGKRGDVKFIHVADFKGYDLGKYTFLITGFKPL